MCVFAASCTALPTVPDMNPETNPKLMTIPVGLATVQGSFGIRYADTMASAILGALPLVAVYLLFQRHIVEGGGLRIAVAEGAD